MEMLWFSVFIVSSFLLTFVVFRAKTAWKWLGQALFQVMMAAVLLYIVNTVFTELAIAMNMVTLLTVSILGVPGLLLLAAIQLFVL
jgi:inhibitor of the pro-sigma K processing machinery